MRQPAPSAADLALLDPDGRFRLRLARDLVHLRELTAGTPSATQMAELGRLVHGLAGAAGTFGFPEIGDAAIALDDALIEGTASADVRPLITTLLAALAAI